MSALEQPYDALLLVSFGGPQRREDVIPFLENVVRGRNVPRERLLEVAEHYYHFGGSSPINEQNRQLVEKLRQELERNGPKLPIYWGNRNWHPLLADTLRQMAADGVRRALAFVTSAFSSYSGCRQYRENIEAARQEVGSAAPRVEKLRVFYNHPLFVEAVAERAAAALDEIGADGRAAAPLLFTAHSIPVAMAANCRYEEQLREASRLVTEALPGAHAWRLVYQSRSGPPSQPWLEPDVGHALRELAAGGARDVVVVPIGFLSDHLEVLYDLDVDARGVAESAGLNMVRCRTVGTHTTFVTMIRELVLERLEPGRGRRVRIARSQPRRLPRRLLPAATTAIGRVTQPRQERTTMTRMTQRRDPWALRVFVVHRLRRVRLRYNGLPWNIRCRTTSTSASWSGCTSAAPGNDFYAPKLTISHAATELVIPIDRRFHHSAGAAHGSVYFKALDDAAFFAVNSLVPDVFVLTVTFTTYLTGPISEGEMRAKGRVVHAAKSFFLAESVVCDSAGCEIGRGSGSFTRSRVHLTPEIGYY